MLECFVHLVLLIRNDIKTCVALSKNNPGAI